MRAFGCFCILHSLPLADLKSLPLVELVRSGDALEFPEISLVEAHGLRVSASEALSNVGVVESLAVAELLVAEGETEGGTEHKTSSQLHVVSVEVSMGSSCLGVGESADSADGTADHAGGTTKDLVHVSSTPEIHVEVLGVVLDELSHLDLALHRFIRLLHVVLVANDMRAVSSHFNFFLVMYLKL